jgi:hypothetical protein
MHYNEGTALEARSRLGLVPADGAPVEVSESSRGGFGFVAVLDLLSKPTAYLRGRPGLVFAAAALVLGTSAGICLLVVFEFDGQASLSPVPPPRAIQVPSGGTMRSMGVPRSSGAPTPAGPSAPGPSAPVSTLPSVAATSLPNAVRLESAGLSGPVVGTQVAPGARPVDRPGPNPISNERGSFDGSLPTAKDLAFIGLSSQDAR